MGDFGRKEETLSERRELRQRFLCHVYFSAVHVQMTFDRFKAFLADDMLDAAGIFRGGLLINTKAHQPRERSWWRS